MSMWARIGLAGGVITLAACGGASATPGVASLAGSNNVTTTTVSRQTLSQLWHAAAECMRQHGVPMADPVIGDGGGTKIQVGGPGLQKSAVDAASTACQSLFDAAMKAGPGGRRPSPADAAKLVKSSQCMRAHGIRDFPDPSASGGIRLGGSSAPGAGSSTDLNPDNPAFQKAQTACQKLLPGGGAKLSTSQGAHP
jgi:hypothetical protein